MIRNHKHVYVTFVAPLNFTVNRKPNAYNDKNESMTKIILTIHFISNFLLKSMYVSLRTSIYIVYLYVLVCNQSEIPHSNNRKVACMLMFFGMINKNIMKINSHWPQHNNKLPINIKAFFIQSKRQVIVYTKGRCLQYF